MDFRALADFNLVASNGGLGRASRASGLPKATLSRHIVKLEESLGVRLVERGSRALKLTEHGASLYERTQATLKELTESMETIASGNETPRGRLRVSAPVLISHLALGAVAAKFVRAYPQVQVEIVAEDRFVDPIEEGYDIVVRINPQSDDRLVGRKIVEDEMLVVAPPALERPAWRAGLGASAPAVVLTTAPSNAVWRVRHGQDVVELAPAPVLRLSTLLLVRDAVLAGAGAALLPRSIVGTEIERGRLAFWGTAEGRPVSIWALHTSRRLTSLKVQAFIEILVDAFPKRLLTSD